MAGNGRQAMIVEDEALVAFAMEEAVISAGCSRAFLARRSDDALGLLTRERIDFALLDLHLADGDTSLAVADELQRLGIPFAFVTGSDMTELRLRYPDVLLIGKPADEPLIRAATESLLSPGSRRQAAEAAAPAEGAAELLPQP